MDDKGGRQNTRVFLENLPDLVRKDEIGKEFYNFGDIAKIYLMYDNMGSGFVEFFDADDAANAADQMNGANFRGTRLKTRLTQGGVARGRGNFEGGSRGRGYTSNYGDRYGSSRFESSGGYHEDSGYQNRRGGYPRRGRGGRDRFESRDSGRTRNDRDWDWDNNERESSFGGRRFSSRYDREGFSSRGRRDYSDRDVGDGMQNRRSNYERNEYTTRDTGRYSRSNYRRVSDREHSSRDFNEPPPFKKSYRSAEENDIIVGIKPSRYMKKMHRDPDNIEDEFDDGAEKYSSYRKSKREKEMILDSDPEDYHHLRDRSRSPPMMREKKEHYTTSSYDQKAMSYVTEDGMHRSHRTKHSEKPMREEKDFVSSHKRHRSREETGRY